MNAIIEKVQKLLKLSQSSNAHEASAAAGAANKLIDAYRLSEADFESHNSSTDPLVEDQGYVYETGRIIPWKNFLIHVLSEHYGVAHFNDNYYPEGRKVSRYKLIGRASDIQIVRYMFAWLSLECQRLADAHVKGQGRVTVASYCNGFVSGISEQLKASRKEAEREVSSQAIIKLDARLRESEDFMYANHKNLKRTKAMSHSRVDRDAFMAGQTHGKNIHLGKAMAGSKVKLLGK